MAAPVKPTQPIPHASRNSPATFPALADATIQYALIDGPDYIEAAADFTEAQAAIAEAAAQDLLTTFTDFSGNADSLTSSGVYKLASGVTNAFTGAGDNDFIFHLQYDVNNATQHGYEGGAKSHIRSKVAGTWDSWGPVSAPGLAFISTIDFAGEAVGDFTGFDATKYDSYEFILSNLIPSNDGAITTFITSGDGGSSYDIGASDYSYGHMYISTGGSITTFSDNTYGVLRLSIAVGNAAGEDGLSGVLNIMGPHLPKYTVITASTSYLSSATAWTTFILSGARRSSAAVDAVRFYPNTGNYISGTISMYGRTNS